MGIKSREQLLYNEFFTNLSTLVVYSSDHETQAVYNDLIKIIDLLKAKKLLNKNIKHCNIDGTPLDYIIHFDT
ncbi:hypothetical protein [Wolbachia endosymbiont of Pentidionis agamae]|uniref:hypothetical protein n=1 Tax=Wolbachia endosymbiont of Pentidionis agamae TaxID=3110435 RepID=UPI002FCF3B2B